MSDTAFEDDATGASDDARFASMIRKSVREVVEGVLVQAPGNVDTRQDIRAAGDRFGNALVAHAATAERPANARPPHTSNAAAEAAPMLDTSDRRARAFRAMTGVRLQPSAREIG